MVNKKAQVTIFIIIAIVIIGLVVLFFMLRGYKIIPDIGGVKKEINPPAFLDSCLEDKIREAVKILGEQGGNIEPKLYKTFKFIEEGYYKNISYLCYNRNSTKHCVNQEPALIKHLENEIHGYIEEDVESCFTDLGNSLDKQGYVVDSRYGGFDVELMPNKIITNINGEIILTKADKTSREKDFRIITSSKIYDLVVFANKIIRKEAESCEFDIALYRTLYPKIEIIKDQSYGPYPANIYTLKDKKGAEKFRFAVSKGCMSY